MINVQMINTNSEFNAQIAAAKKRAAWERKMSIRRNRTALVVGLICVFGINVASYRHSESIKPSITKMVEKEVRDMNERTRLTDMTINEVAHR